MPARTQSRDPATDPCALLGGNLRTARMEAGYRSQDALADELRIDRTVVTKAETGERPPNDILLKDWLDLCRVTGLARFALEGEWRLARSKEGPLKAWIMPWFKTEAEAHTLRYWAPVIVPGLSQTPDYARELFAAMGMDDEKIAEFLEVRMGRQAIIDRDDPPDITIVLWEPVLHHLIGTPQIMRDQLARLVDLSRKPWVHIHILPSRLGANPGLGGALNLAATDTSPELLLSDGLGEDRLSVEPAALRRARATFSSVRADALNRADSRDLLMAAITTWSD